MKIEMTQEQFETVCHALIYAEVALESTIAELKAERREMLAKFRETQLKIVKSALEVFECNKLAMQDAKHNVALQNK